MGETIQGSPGGNKKKEGNKDKKVNGTTYSSNHPSWRERIAAFVDFLCSAEYIGD